ncbi:MAG: ATP-binding cassette domain-containing protein [Actinobacteria bacterium]|nr:ATP-binding cassette domain-containing protein [Actinomycetota bacterium]
MITGTDATRPFLEEASLVIETSGLTKVYPGGLKAVDDLDLTVWEGEIFGLLGPNGAGKTTTVGMLTTRVVPTQGSATVRGVDVVARPTIAKQLIGVVSQSNTLDRSVDVWENLYFHGRYFGMSSRDARSRADESLELFRLTDRAHVDVSILSGGMAQRLMVARAIMHRPQVLFLDEPTAGLDPQSRLALWDILGDLNDAGQTILMTTHYMEEAEQLCRRVAIMDHGKLLALDTPIALKRSLGADTVVTITTDGRLEELSRHIEAMQGVTRVHVVDETVRVGLRGSNGVLPRILGHAEDGGFHVKDLSIAEPTLETVFITLTGRELRE